MSAAINTGYVNRPVLAFIPFAILSLYACPLSSSEIGVQFDNIHISSAWRGTSDCKNIVDFLGSSPNAK